MELSPYVESVRRGVQDAAALADDHTRQVAERLGTGVESAARLALIQALADAASEISVELAPGSVDLRMQGAEPTFVVALPPPVVHEATVLQPADEPAPAEPPADGDEQQARVSLRLPQSVKEKVDEHADADGVSTNTWLLHRVLEALAERTRGGRGRGRGWGIDISHDGVRLDGPPPRPAPPPPPFRGGPPSPDDGRRPERGQPEGGRGADRGRGGEAGSGPVQGWVR